MRGNMNYKHYTNISIQPWFHVGEINDEKYICIFGKLK